MTMDAPRPTNRDQVKKMLEKIMDKDDGLPCFGVCEKPADDPETLDTHDDLFLKDGKSRYPLIGVLHFYATPFKFVHSSTQFGIMFDKKHQGKFNSLVAKIIKQCALICRLYQVRDTAPSFCVGEWTTFSTLSTYTSVS